MKYDPTATRRRAEQVAARLHAAEQQAVQILAEADEQAARIIQTAINHADRMRRDAEHETANATAYRIKAEQDANHIRERATLQGRVKADQIRIQFETRQKKRVLS